MNLFYLDEDFQKSAEYHVDKHVVKMPLEAAQILCTAIHLTQPDVQSTSSSFLWRGLRIYGKTHQGHPCCRWACESRENWVWVKRYCISVADEYEYRYGKTHKVLEIVKDLPLPYLPNRKTPFKLAMPDSCKIYSNPVFCYRYYYLTEKSHLASWKTRELPWWWTAPEILIRHSRV